MGVKVVRPRASELVIAIAVLLAPAAPAIAASQAITAEFGQICVRSKSSRDLKAGRTTRGWRLLPTLTQSNLERVIATVTPMLEAQGLTSNYTVYSLDSASRHLELAISETVKPVIGARKLIGCSIYDFGAVAPIDSATVQDFAPSSVGKRSFLGDVQVEKWTGAFGTDSDMRSVFVPQASPVKDQLGFTGVMLGASFLDAAQ